MELERINPRDIIFALDIGTRSIIGTVGVVKDKKYHVICEQYVEHEERAMIDGQIHDISLVAKAVNHVKKELEKELDFTLTKVSIAAAGRFLRTAAVKSELDSDGNTVIDRDTIRTLELTAVKSAENEINTKAEGKLYCVGYSVKSYYLNGYVITNLLSHKGEKIGVEVIATFLPRSVVDSLYEVMNRVGLEVTSLTLEPIAAIEAVIPQNLRLLNLALVDIGAGTSDIAISSKDTIAAYGMVPMAGDEVTEAIANACLVDFNTAERMKREAAEKESVSYIDVLGFENEVSSEELFKVVVPVVEKISQEIASRIVELNGGKAPNALFLVGGGSHTPKLRDMLADKLGLTAQRAAIKGREAVSDCVCNDNSLGSIGVTVLGIALVSIKRMGNDFINVFLNGKIISLFNSHKISVADVLLQAGVNPKVLLGKNGRNIKFSVNGTKRIAFGALAVNSQITVNGAAASIDTVVKEGDNIDIKFAKDGKEAAPKVKDYVTGIYSTNFSVNDIEYQLEPLCFINSNRVNLDQSIEEDDHLQILYPETLRDFMKFYLKDDKKEYKCFLKDKEIYYDYTIVEGDKIYMVHKEEIAEAAPTSTGKPQNMDNEVSALEDYKNPFIVVVNDKPVTLKGKDKYIFIDIFEHIDFDRTIARGNLMLLLNGERAGYYSELKERDIIKVYWE
jgi:cell division protein FtsA